MRKRRQAMKVYVALITYRGEEQSQKWYVAKTQKGLFSKLAVVVREWYKKNREEEPLSKNDQSLVEQYFSDRACYLTSCEILSWGCADLEAPTTVDAAAADDGKQSSGSGKAPTQQQ